MEERIMYLLDRVMELEEKLEHEEVMTKMFMDKSERLENEVRDLKGVEDEEV